MNKTNKSLKTLLKSLTYSVFAIIILNFILGKIDKKENSNDKFYEVLKEEKYFSTLNPYKSINSLKLNPTTYFSINKKRLTNNLTMNNIYTLDDNGFRTNPFLSKVQGDHSCILVLGSSAAFGNGSSSDKNTIAAQINKRLGLNYKVYNLSAPSWNSRQELISYLNFLNLEISSQCSKINTISFTGNADLNNIIFSKKSKLYNNIDTRKELLNSPEQYYILENNVDIVKEWNSGIRFKIKHILEDLVEISLGNIFNYIKNAKSDNEVSHNINKADKSFIDDQIKSFIINQKIIANITKNKKGQHLVVLQPSLKNLEKGDLHWDYSNRVLSKHIKETCLEVLDLRLYFTDKLVRLKVNERSRIISLKDSIRNGLYKKNSINEYYYFDKSHLTDKGYKLVAEEIAENFIINKDYKECKEI